MAGADCVSVAEVFVSVLEGVVVDGGVDQVVGIGRLGGQHIHREHRRRRHKGSCHTTSESTNNSAIKSAITSVIKAFHLLNSSDNNIAAGRCEHIPHSIDCSGRFMGFVSPVRLLTEACFCQQKPRH